MVIVPRGGGFPRWRGEELGCFGALRVAARSVFALLRCGLVRSALWRVGAFWVFAVLWRVGVLWFIAVRCGVAFFICIYRTVSRAALGQSGFGSAARRARGGVDGLFSGVILDVKHEVGVL